MDEYTYILAPYNANNWAVLLQALAQNPEISEENRVKLVYQKSAGDVLGADGVLLVPADPKLYIYLKAHAKPNDPALLAFLHNVQDYSLYLQSNQPFEIYWL